MERPLIEHAETYAQKLGANLAASDVPKWGAYIRHLEADRERMREALRAILPAFDAALTKAFEEIPNEYDEMQEGFGDATAVGGAAIKKIVDAALAGKDGG
jgi:hypothetical protein